MVKIKWNTGWEKPRKMPSLQNLMFANFLFVILSLCEASGGKFIFLARKSYYNNNYYYTNYRLLSVCCVPHVLLGRTTCYSYADWVLYNSIGANHRL